MAQSYDQLTERRKKLQEQLDEVDGQLEELKKVRRDELLAELKELGFEGKRVTKSGTQRAPKRCSICVKAGKPGTGHTKRTHAAWLKEQKE